MAGGSASTGNPQSGRGGDGLVVVEW
jgi:hypothetical protein